MVETAFESTCSVTASWPPDDPFSCVESTSMLDGYRTPSWDLTVCFAIIPSKLDCFCKNVERL